MLPTYVSLPEAKAMSFRSDKNSENVLPFPGRRPHAVAPQADPPLPVLVVLHQETSTPGRVGNALRALGHRLDIRRPRFGDALPETLDEHAGAVIFGGPMSANDPRRLRPPRDRLDRGSPARAAAVSRHLPRRADARHAARREGRAASARPHPDRLLPDPPDRGRAARLPELAGSRLSLASRGV